MKGYQNKKVAGDLKSLFYAIPKTELHVHLSGAYSKDMIRTLFEKQGFTKTEAAQKAAVPDKFERLDKDFIPLYFDIAKLIKHPEDIYKATYEMLRKASEDNVWYMELKISNQEVNPQAFTEKDFNSAEELAEYKDEMYQAIFAATKKAEKNYGIKVMHLFTLERHNSIEQTVADAEMASKWAQASDSIMIGFDLAGDEYNFPVTMHKEAIDTAFAQGLDHFAPHAGESPTSGEFTDVESVRKCIEMGAKRIGHGLAIVKDKGLIKEVKEKDITVEVSPSSNVMLNLAESYEDHPVRQMLKEGLKVTICSDDPAMFETKISKEYEYLYKAGIISTWDELKNIVMNGVDAAFLPEKEEQKLKDKFEKELKLIEESPYFQHVIEKYL